MGGPGGLLQVVVQRAKHLGDQQQQQQTSGRSLTAPSTDAKGATRTPTSFTSNAAKLSSYCEVKFDNVLLRTPIVHHLSIVEARWDRQLSLALPFELCDLAKSGTGGGHSVSEGGAACTPTASSSTHTGLGRGSAGGSSSKRDEFVIAVLDAQTVGQPVLLGTAKVSEPGYALTGQVLAEASFASSCIVTLPT